MIRDREKKLHENLKAEIKREMLPENKMSFPKDLGDFHPYVEAWIAKDEERQVWNSRSFKWEMPPKKPPSPIEIRRRKIFTALIGAFESRTLKVEAAENWEIWVSFRGEKISITISERMRQARIQRTARDAKLYGRDWEQIVVPDGTLMVTFKISYQTRALYEKRSWPLETQFNQIVVAMLRLVWKMKANRLSYNSLRRTIEVQDRIRADRQKKIEEEEERIEDLEKEARDWRKAKNIRDYVDAIQRAHQQQLIDESLEVLERWKGWALSHADDLDPLTNGEALGSAVRD